MDSGNELAAGILLIGVFLVLVVGAALFLLLWLGRKSKTDRIPKKVLRAKTVQCSQCDALNSADTPRCWSCDAKLP